MIPICDQCGGLIAVSNRRFAGYCSPACRDVAHQGRNQPSARPAEPEPTQERPYFGRSPGSRS